MPISDTKVLLRTHAGEEIRVGATGAELRDGQLVLVCDGDVVLAQPVEAVATLTWPAARGRTLEEIRERLPRAFLRWSEEERERLTAAVAAGTPWPQIAQAHGRGVGGVHSEAQRLGLVAAEEPQPR